MFFLLQVRRGIKKQNSLDYMQTFSSCKGFYGQSQEPCSSFHPYLSFLGIYKLSLKFKNMRSDLILKTSSVSFFFFLNSLISWPFNRIFVNSLFYILGPSIFLDSHTHNMGMVRLKKALELVVLCCSVILQFL